MNARWLRTYARLGWLATTLALGIALVVGSWLNYRGAVAAVSALNRGQADLLESALREATSPGTTQPDTVLLRRLLEEHAASGLRYVAVLDPEGRVLASAGEPASRSMPSPRRSGPPDTPIEIVELEGRVRATFARPPLRRPPSRSGPDRGAEPAPSSPGLERGPGPPPSGYVDVIEFEPVARGLVGRARRALVLAGVGAGILTLAALLAWRTSESYERARRRLEEQRRLTLLGEMGAVLAHEIRNPLASLKGNAQLLAERLAEGSRDRTRAERVVAEAKRLEALTSDLLEFARSGPLELRPTDPAELLRTAAEDVGPDAFELDTSGAAEAWPMDAGRIRAVLLNVLQNAGQASAPGRRPRARVSRVSEGLVFEVRDFGPGLPPGSETRIFDPFFTTRTNGTGLGLAVARRVAEMHGGRITAGNHPEGGAVFRIVLPRARS